MAHGTPDWGVTAGRVTTYQLTDLGELAVRLGSIDSFDRRGDAVFFDSFEDGLAKWVTGVSGSGGSAYLSLVSPRSGDLSALLTAGKDVGHYAQLQFSRFLPVLGPMGVEFSFAVGVNTESVELLVYIDDGTNRTNFNVRWVQAAKALQYKDSTPKWVTIASDVDLFAHYATFHTLKLVINAVTDNYVRILLDYYAHALAGIAAEVGASLGLPQLIVIIKNIGRAGSNDDVYVDDVIITQNEPV